MEPRSAQPKVTEPPLCLFTDGACEGSLVIAGGMLFCEDGLRMFGTKLPERIYGKWAIRPGSRTIGQCRIYPVLVALNVWAERLRGRRIVIFVDNDSSRHALVRQVLASGSSVFAFEHPFCPHKVRRRSVVCQGANSGQPCRCTVEIRPRTSKRGMECQPRSIYPCRSVSCSGMQLLITVLLEKSHTHNACLAISRA